MTTPPLYHALPCPALPCSALPCSALLFHLSTGGRFNDVYLPKFRGRKHGCSTYWGSRPELPTTNNGLSSTRHQDSSVDSDTDFVKPSLIASVGLHESPWARMTRLRTAELHFICGLHGCPENPWIRLRTKGFLHLQASGI